MIDTATSSFAPIQSSRQDTCPTQRAVATHNSVYDTLKSGKPVIYQAACDREPKTAQSKREAKRS